LTVLKTDCILVKNLVLDFILPALYNGSCLHSKKCSFENRWIQYPCLDVIRSIVIFFKERQKCISIVWPRQATSATSFL